MLINWNILKATEKIQPDQYAGLLTSFALSNGILTPLAEILSKYDHSIVNLVKIGFGKIQDEFPLYEESECEEIQKFTNGFLAKMREPKKEAESDNKTVEAKPGKVREEIRFFGNLLNI